MQNLFSDMSILFWNINGVANKFKTNDVIGIFNKGHYDVIVMIETHFNIRIRCPPQYNFVAKSKQSL